MTDSGDDPGGTLADDATAAADADRTDAPEATGPDSEGGDAAGESSTGTSAPLVFLLGGVAFLGGVAAFAADLVTGHDVLRSLAVNAAGALLLVGWAAVDTLRDPESTVDSRGGAAGTALLLYAVYLLGAGVVVGVTSIRHGRPGLALLCGGGAVVAAVVGLLVFPTAVVVGADGTAEGGSDDGAGGHGEQD